MFILRAYYKNNKGELVNPCGTDYTFIVRDLKTIRGVKNRMNRYRWFKGADEVRVYKWYGSLTYEEAENNLLAVITKKELEY